MKRVSFDYDGTLDIEIVQEYAKYLVDRGIDVWICTTRCTSGFDRTGWYNNDDVYDIAEEIGITKVIFTENNFKYKFLKNNDIIWHLDNCNIETKSINSHSDIVGIRLFEKGWKEKCEKLLF